MPSTSNEVEGDSEDFQPGSSVMQPAAPEPHFDSIDTTTTPHEQEHHQNPSSVGGAGAGAVVATSVRPDVSGDNRMDMAEGGTSNPIENDDASSSSIIDFEKVHLDDASQGCSLRDDDVSLPVMDSYSEDSQRGSTAMQTTATDSPSNLAIMKSPPVPDAQLFAAHEDNEAGTGEETTTRKPEVIEDDDPAPLPVAATASAMDFVYEDRDIKGTAKNVLEIIEDGDYAPEDYAASGHEGEAGDLKKNKPAAAPELVTQTQPQTEIQQQPETVSPSRPNQDGTSNQDPVNNSVQDLDVQESTSTRPQVRPPPQSMLPHPLGESDVQAQSAPMLHEVEARLVEDEPPVPVYEATILHENPSAEAGAGASWWEKHRRYALLIGIVLVMGVGLIVMGTQVASQRSSDGLRGGPEPTKSPTELLVSNVPDDEQRNNSTTMLYSNSSVESVYPPDDKSHAAPLEDSNSTVQELYDPSSDEPPTLRPSNLSLAKITQTPTSNPIKSPTIKPTNSVTAKPTPTLPLNSIVRSQKLLPSDGEEANNFGNALSVSGDTAVIGAGYDNDNGDKSGSAYIFIRDGDTWKQLAKLLPDDGQADDHFGFAVALDGDTAVVAAPFDDDNGDRSGAAYVFIRDGDKWTQQAKLLPNDGQAMVFFGYGVSVSGDTVVIGARYDNDNGVSSGSAYVFIRDGDMWKQQAKLLPNDGQPDDRFGSSVSVSGDTAVIGNYLDDDNGSNSGSAYVFVRDGKKWNQQAKLVPSDGQEQEGINFGNAVSINGDLVVIGAWRDDNNSGSAYVFIRNGNVWNQQAKLLPNDGQKENYFGRAVSLSDNTVVVGSFLDDDNGDGSGSAYVFIWDGDKWKQQAKLLANDGQPDDRFGSSVSVSGDAVFIGVPLADDYGDESGAVHVFQIK